MGRTSSASKPARPQKSSSGVKTYLFAYNTLSALGWGYILLKLVFHIAGRDFPYYSSPSSPSSSSSAHTALASFSSILTTVSLRLPSIPFLSPPPSRAAQLYYNLKLDKLRVPAALQPALVRATTAYGAVGVVTAAVQTCALLEILHCLLGWVRSPVATTAAQVSSRLFLVWGVTERYEVARTTPLYSSMVLAWSLAEIIRYVFYALSLLPLGSNSTSSTSYVPSWLIYLRYSAFYVLYIVGASSEAFVNFQTLPRGSPIPSLGGWLGGSAVWTPYDLLRGVLFVIWWPGLYIMYTHMIGQRRKALGKGQKLGAKPKSL
ncbi:PTPLA-domain-containing protein [Schizopora paradoxa]|uniref:Very-long-chain (3R)-3-hydroxyacyl-CoA dehydratase n=1 Tax=Schizopora paradoxa TaxID=27342 RepID=A0A0H2RK42_9AGAM|nr:PTPLA-domain-containing protein [Schizopora paradoxa]